MPLYRINVSRKSASYGTVEVRARNFDHAFTKVQAMDLSSPDSGVKWGSDWDPEGKFKCMQSGMQVHEPKPNKE